MKEAEQKTAPKISKVKVDKSLNKYQNKVLFKSTLEKAQKALKNLKLPGNFKEDKNHI